MFKHDQTYQTPLHIIKQGDQTVKCLITKQRLMMFGRRALVFRFVAN